MSESSRFLTALSRDGGFRLILTDAGGVVEKMRTIHACSRTMTAALGRSLIACSLMGKLVKEEGSSVTLRIEGGGPAGRIVCVADCEGNVRGCCDDPSVELPPNEKGKLDVGGAVGREGSLYVIRDMGFGEPYVGYSPLVSGEIAEDVTEYFTVSEQTPSVCALGVRVDRDGRVTGAGGYLLQLMPGADERITPILQANIDYMPALSQLLAEGKSLEEIAGEVFGLVEYDVLESSEAAYRCTCSKEKYAAALVSLGSGELKEILEEDGGAEIVCQFCNTRYYFDSAELAALVARAEARAAAEKEGEENP